MTDNTTKYEESTKDQTIATLYLSEEGLDYTNVRDFIADYLQNNEGAPNGATFVLYDGLWKGKIEKGIQAEIWYDGQKELRALLELRNALQEKFNQYCVCMKFSNNTMRHRHPEQE